MSTTWKVILIVGGTLVGSAIVFGIGAIALITLFGNNTTTNYARVPGEISSTTTVLMRECPDGTSQPHDEYCIGHSTPPATTPPSTAASPGWTPEQDQRLLQIVKMLQGITTAQAICATGIVENVSYDYFTEQITTTQEAAMVQEAAHACGW